LLWWWPAFIAVVVACFHYTCCFALLVLKTPGGGFPRCRIRWQLPASPDARSGPYCWSRGPIDLRLSVQLPKHLAASNFMLLVDPKSIVCVCSRPASLFGRSTGQLERRTRDHEAPLGKNKSMSVVFITRPFIHVTIRPRGHPEGTRSSRRYTVF